MTSRDHNEASPAGLNPVASTALDGLELRSLSCFVAVAEAGGFRRASAANGVLQSVLSRKVRGLEDRLGVSLFERHRGGVRLTNAGSWFLEDVRMLFAKLEEAASTLHAAGVANRGRLNVGIATSISTGFVNRLLRRWKADHPRVALTIRDATPRELVAQVVQRRLDVTFVTGSTVPPGCEMEPLWTERVFFATGAAHPLSNRPALTLDEIAGEPLIVGRTGFGLEIRDFLIKGLSDLGVSPIVEIQDVGREMLFTMVGLGFGSTLAAMSGTAVSYPGVVYVPIRDVRLPFNAVWSPANDNPAMRRFLSMARILSGEEQDP